MTRDPEATQLGQLAEDQRLLRLAEMDLEILERTSATEKRLAEEEKQRAKTVKERADAIDARFNAVERIVLHQLLWLYALVLLAVVVVEAVRFFG
jgi:hypothetical protein